MSSAYTLKGKKSMKWKICKKQILLKRYSDGKVELARGKKRGKKNTLVYDLFFLPVFLPYIAADQSHFNPPECLNTLRSTVRAPKPCHPRFHQRAETSFINAPRWSELKIFWSGVGQGTVGQGTVGRVKHTRSFWYVSTRVNLVETYQKLLSTHLIATRLHVSNPWVKP